MKGSVLWFNPKLGYGFIKSEDNQEIFFHWTDILVDNQHYKTIYRNTSVEFDVIIDPKTQKLHAINVKPLQRINPANNKKLVAVSYLRCDNTHINKFIIRILNKSAAGLIYLNVYNDYIISSDKLLTKDEIKQIVEKINIHKNIRFNTIIELPDNEYDLIFL